jgi:L-ribulose-5-phosphate 4-epimerase
VTASPLNDPAVADAVARARAEVCALHAELVATGLVAWTSGNISARVRDLIIIKGGWPLAGHIMR